MVEIIGDLLAKDVGLAEDALGAAPAVLPAEVETALAGIRKLLAARG
jgi:hypothetical protein